MKINEKFVLKALLLIVGIFFIPTVANNLMAQQNTQDVIYLKNGSVIKGIIVEQIPNESYKIETSDGNIFVFSAADVEKIIKEKVQNQTANQILVIREKNPTVACIASLIFPGLGQIVNEEYWKGLGFFLGFVGGLALAGSDVGIEVLGAIVAGGCYLGSIIEAPVSASSYNRKLLEKIELGGVKYLSFEPNFSIKQFGMNKSIFCGVALKLNL